MIVIPNFLKKNSTHKINSVIHDIKNNIRILNEGITQSEVELKLIETTKSKRRSNIKSLQTKRITKLKEMETKLNDDIIRARKQVEDEIIELNKDHIKSKDMESNFRDTQIKSLAKVDLTKSKSEDAEIKSIEESVKVAQKVKVNLSKLFD